VDTPPTYAYEELRTAAKLIKDRHGERLDRETAQAALLLARFVDTYLDLNDETEGR